MDLKKIFIFQLLFFASVLISGIFTSFKILDVLGGQASVRPVSFFSFVLSVAIATVFVFLLLKVSFKRKALQALFLFSVASGSFFFWGIWLGEAGSLALLAVLIFSWFFLKNILVHNLLIFSGITGIGSVIGLRFDPVVVALLMAAFSVYDIVAVYKTKHMVKMASAMVDAGAVLGVIFTPDLKGAWGKTGEVRLGGRHVVLGGGDILFPLLLCVSLAPYGLGASLFVFVFAAIGLAVSFLIFVSQKERKPIPALPPIALFSIIGFLIARFLPCTFL